MWWLGGLECDVFCCCVCVGLIDVLFWLCVGWGVFSWVLLVGCF